MLERNSALRVYLQVTDDGDVHASAMVSRLPGYDVRSGTNVVRGCASLDTGQAQQGAWNYYIRSC